MIRDPRNVRIMMTILLMVWSSMAHAQHDRRNVSLTDLLRFSPQAVSREGTGRCYVNSGLDENELAFCSDRTCASPKKHMERHCNCPQTARIFADGHYYTVLNPCEPILLYKRVINVNKWTSFKYYFSAGPDTTLIRLTKDNLKKAFAGNPAFRMKIDAVFKNNSQLTRFDKLYDMYLVNWLYAYESQKLPLETNLAQ